MIFITNKYTKWYNSIITSTKERTGYTEKHHIVPKSIGGSNKKDNLVALTAREHFICHQLLVRMTVGTDRSKMAQAAWRMCCANKGDRYKITSRTYEITRSAFSEILKKRVGPLSNRYGKPGPNLGKAMSKETKAKLSATKKANPVAAWNKGIPRTEDEKALMSANRKGKDAWNKGKPHSKETLAKIAERARNRVVHTCPHCGKQATGANYLRWHGDNCRTILSSAVAC